VVRTIDASRRHHREARRLIERWRAGELAHSALEHAAYLDHVPARIASDTGPAPTDLEVWVRGLRRLPVLLELRAFAAMVAWGTSDVLSPAASEALSAARAACLDRANGSAAARAAQALARAHCGEDELGQGFYRYAGKTNDAELVYYLAQAASDPDLWLGRDLEVWEDLDPVPPTLWGPPHDLVLGAALVLGRTPELALALRRAVENEVVPWLLSQDDPLLNG
jgi:hypothetical protein